MRSRIITCLGAAAVFAACGGSENAPGGSLSVDPPVTSAGAAGSGPLAPPTAATNSQPSPTASSQPTPQQPTAPTPMQQPPTAMPGANPPPAAMPGAMPQPPTAMPPAGVGGVKLAMDECGLMTKYPGDEYCINAPPADKGFQMHVGPSNYDNPESRFVLQPGQEITENIGATAGNTSEVYYYWRQYRMRPGSHHLIITSGGRRLGGSSNAAKDNPEAGKIAPENEGVGMRLAARASLSNSLHYFNFTDKPIIKEVWVNFWYRDKSEVTEPTTEIFSMLGMDVRPGTHVNKRGSCTISQPGRLLTVYGHVHAHNKRFSVWRKRGADRMLIHEAYDWEHPNISEYSTTVMNPTLAPGMKKDGGVSGIVDLKAGDVVEFECEIVNDTNSVFRGLNEAEDDEMCILIGDAVGTNVPGLCASQDLPGGPTQ